MSTSTRSVAPRVGVFAWWVQGVRLLRGEMRRRWYLFAALALIWVLASMRVFVHHAPLLPLMVNWTPSIPYRLVYVDYNDRALSRGDLIVYAFEGEAAHQGFPGLKDQPFFKRIVGVAGDTVTVSSREVFVNGVSVGVAKTHTFDRRPLDPIGAGVIPAGYLYVQGASPDSFDSRYRSSGLVSVRNVAARVKPIF
jgi:conjugal transfer pilin signal peptidase TrbI